jgi:hypothetical protein
MKLSATQQRLEKAWDVLQSQFDAATAASKAQRALRDIAVVRTEDAGTRFVVADFTREIDTNLSDIAKVDVQRHAPEAIGMLDLRQKRQLSPADLEDVLRENSKLRSELQGWMAQAYAAEHAVLAHVITNNLDVSDVAASPLANVPQRGRTALKDPDAIDVLLPHTVIADPGVGDDFTARLLGGKAVGMDGLTNSAIVLPSRPSDIVVWDAFGPRLSWDPAGASHITLLTEQRLAVRVASNVPAVRIPLATAGD